MPKRIRKPSTKKAKYSYDPELEQGYAILRNLDSIEDIGTAIQSHDQTRAGLIDSKAAEYWRLNAEELEWEKKKQEDKLAADEIDELLTQSRNSVLGQLAEGSNVSGGIGKEADAVNTAGAEKFGRAYGHVGAKDIPNIPDNYRMSDFLKDQWNSFFGEMNELQTKDAEGYKIRALNDKNLINTYMHSLDILDQIDLADGLISYIDEQLGQYGLTVEQRNSLRALSAQLKAARTKLQQEYDSLSNERKLLEDTVRTGGVKSAWNDLMSGNQIFGSDSWWNIPGKTTAAHDELNDARRFIYDLGSGKRSRQETRNMLNRALLEYDKLDEGWNAVIAENKKDAEYHKNKISSWFQGRADKTQIAFTDPDTYLFKMPGIIGGSSSSFMKLAPAMISSILGGLAAGAATGGVAWLAAGAGALGSFTMNYGAGISENNAEVALAARERIKDRTGLEDKDIDALIAGKLDDPKKLRAITENITDVENLFNKDMAATTWDAAIDAMLGAVPVGAIAKMNSYVRGTKAWARAMENPAVKKALESKFGKDLVSGYHFGEVASPLVGGATAIANATAGRAARAGLEKAGDILMRKVDDTYTGSLAKALGKRMMMIAKGSEKLAPDVDDLVKATKKGINSQYMKDIGGRLIKSAISEGIEEGKQHVNAEEFKNTVSGDTKLMSTMDIAFTDMINGLTMGAYVLGIPLDGLGIINIKDQDLLQEIKGGMLGGWGQTGMITVAQNTIPFVQKKKAIDVAVEQILNNKLASTAQQKQYRSWLKNGLFNPNENSVKQAFLALREQNDKYNEIYHESPMSTDIIDLAEKKYSWLMSLAQKEDVKLMALDNGINVRDPKNPTSWRSNSKYHDFVSTLAVALDRITDVQKNRDEAIANAIKVEQEVDAKLSASNEGLSEILEYLQADEGSEKRQNGLGTVTGEGWRAEEQTPLDKAVDTILQEGEADARYTKMIAQLAALLKYRDQIETGLNKNPNVRFLKVRIGLKDQLKLINKQIDSLIKKNEDELVHKFQFAVQGKTSDGKGLSNYVNSNQSIRTLSDVEDHLVYNQEEHKALVDAYLEQLKWINEYDSVEKALQNFVGKSHKDQYGNSHFTGGNALKILDLIKFNEDQDDAFEQAVERNFQEGLKAEHLAEQNAWHNGEVVLDSRKKIPVKDANGDQIQVTYDENGRINRRLADNETVDDLGYLWEYEDNAPDYPINRLGRNVNTPLDNAEQDRRLFRETFAAVQGELLPLTPLGMIERRQRALFEAARADGKWPEKEAPVEPKNGLVEPISGTNPDYKGMVERYYETRNRLVPPTTPPTPPVEIKPEEPNDDPQDAVIKEIERRYQEDKQKVQNNQNGYHTTSQDYFVEEDGKVIRASRVHNVKPESYEHAQQEEWVKKSVEVLQSAESYRDIEDMVVSTIELILGKEISLPILENVKTGEQVLVPLGFFEDTNDFEEIAKWWHDNYPDILVYLRYIYDNRNLFFETPTAESKKDLNNTIENLARAFLQYFEQTHPSVLVGNIVDELARNFFGSDVIYNRVIQDGGILWLFDQVNESDGRTYRQLYRNNFDAFSSLIRGLQGQYEYYTKTLKWKLSTLPFTIRANFNDLGWVAGQTDMIGVDSNGKIHIIDFKTSKYTFGNEYLATDKAVKLTQDYASTLRPLTQYDFYTPEGFEERSSKAKRILRAIKSDGYKNIELQWRPEKLDEEGNVITKGYAVIVEKRKPFFGLPNQTYGLQLSAYEDYSNLLTAYAEMLKLNNFDVASIEILPFKVSYDYNFTEPGHGIVNIELQERTPLMLSSNMKTILDGVENRDQQAVRIAQEELHNNIGHLEYKLNALTEKITGDIFNELSDQGKLQYSDFISEVKNALDVASRILYEERSEDIDALNAQNDEIDAILSRFDALLEDLHKDYKEARNKAAELAKNEAKRDQQKKRESQQEIAPAAGIVLAPNKRDSAGNTLHSNLNYKRVNGDPELSRATIAPNFIDDADITLYVEGDDIYADIQFEGHTWQRVLIDSKYLTIGGTTWIPNSKKLYDDIVKLQKDHPGQRIIPVRATMNRTAGRINILVDKDGHYTYQDVRNSDLFAGQDIYDIEFSSQYRRIGYVDANGVVQTFEEGKPQPTPLYQWSDPRMASHPGTLIYLKPVPKNECPNNKKANRVIVAIDRVKLKENDINFIVNSLINPNQLDKPYFKEIGDKVYNLHATNRQLANLMIPIIDNLQQLGNADSIVRDPNNPMIVQIMKRVDLATNSAGRGRFDLTNPAELEAFKKTLASMSIAERHDVLSSRLGTFSTTEDTPLPFGGIRQFFIEQRGAITRLDVTDTIKFDLEDFTTNTKNGVKRQGVNGFAYYLKHGMLITQYGGMGSSNVEIKEATVENKQIAPANVSPNGVLEMPKIGTLQTGSGIIIDSSEIDGLFKTWDYRGNSKPLSEEKARKHIEEILGDNIPVEFYNTFLKVAACQAHVVGNCKTDAIILSSMGWPGVEYHEAFHRVFEMLLPSHERDRIYHKIADRLGLLLYDENGNENKEAFRQVGEYAADHYMDHMNHHITDLKIPFITKIYNKIHDWVSALWHFDDRELYKVFARVNRKEFVNAKPSRQAVDRFNRLFKELHCEIHGVSLDHVVNRPMYDKLRDNVMFCILQGQNVDPSGRNIQDIGKHIDKDTFLAGVEKLKKSGIDIFGDTTDVPTVGQLAMKEIYDNFDNDFFRDDIANLISAISTDFVKQIENDSIEDALSDDVTNANIGEHTRSSYEFSRFSKTSSRVRFFFATLPDTKYEKVIVKDENGNDKVVMKVVLALNEFGLPQYAPVNAVFNEFLNLFHDIDTLSELKARLALFAKEDPLYERMYKSFDKVYKSSYTIKEGVLTRNSDQEALLAQLMNVIRSNKHNFDIARSTTSKNMNGMHRIIIQTTDADYNATFYPTQWNLMLVNGGTPIIKVSANGSLLFNNQIKDVENSFAKIADLFSHATEIRKADNGAAYNDAGIKEWLLNAVVGDSDVYLKLKVNGKYSYYNNPKDPELLDIVKDKIVETLNVLGILISADEFNYMLRNKYGSNDYEALSKMFSSTSREDSMTTFLKFLKDVAPNGKLLKTVRINNKEVKLENAYAKMAFVRDLANWKYQYRHSHDLLTVLATNNNKFYEISDNNYASDVARMINKRTEELDELLSDPFSYFEGEEDVTGERPVYGSLILKEIKRNDNAFITLRNFVGFKTDKRGDYGSDYFQISKREDYVSKATILEQGGIIMPTLSDKKTWLYIDGIKLPGLSYDNTVDDNGNTTPFAAEKLGDQFVISPDHMSQLDNILSQREDVIDQFISYAYSEYESIKKADRDLDEMEKNGTRSDEVANYYKKEQGAKFSSLLGVWVNTYKKDKDGQNIISGEKFISFNNNKKTRKQNIEQAEKYFFKANRDIQRALISRLLHKRLLEEIKTCTNLGLIKRIDDSGNIFGDYENVGLNSQAIDIIYKSIVAKNGQPVDAIATTKYKSLAVMIYLNDISNKAIMSGHEFERVFSGNPAFYKWTYDSETGALIDRTVDELKRLGGVVSTGNNNFTELKDVPSKYLDENGNFSGNYICAEVDNELIESPQIDMIGERMLYGEILTAAYNKEEQRRLKEYRRKYNDLLKRLNDQYAGNISEDDRLSQEDYDWITNADPVLDEQSIREDVSMMLDSIELEDLKKLLDETSIAIAERKAKEATDSYRLKLKDGKIDDGIDVADGGAYITDTMAEMLLRMNGNYSADILDAFKILREEKTSTLMQKLQAYQKVVTTVIGSQKYTAFGRRRHDSTGILVSYYNKMALFPLFKSIATGKMQNVYNKMMSQGVDMLMVNSAVKVGSQGSKPINWNEYALNQDESSVKPVFSDDFLFNTYEQKFLYLRKQLNTDPKEEHMMNMGTQMTKVVMSSLFDGRTYYLQDGTEMNGTELRNDIMNAINTLSNRGYHNILTRFFKTNAKGELVDKDGNVISDKSDARILDETKFAREIRLMMLTKDPDKNIIDGLEIVEQKDVDGNVIKHMRLPLNAISNSNWLESVLISSINGKVIDIETPGAAFIQRSVWAMEGSSMFEKSNGLIQSDEDLPKSINNGERLLMINEEGSMDCVVSYDFIKKMFKGKLPEVPIRDKNRNLIWDLIPETDKNGKIVMKDNKPVYKQKKDKDGNLMVDKDGKPVYKRKIRTREMSFDEARQWLINRGIIGKGATANIIGYRIPTQAQSSIHALRIVDILPVVNDTIILPAEFTKITGSDFDIDKLFLSSVLYVVNREEGEDGKFHQTVSSEFKESSSAYYQNKLIKDYLAVLLDWTSHSDKRQRTVNILHRSIDNDTKLLKDIIKDIEKNKPAVMEEPYGFYSLSTQTESKNDYITGKIGIGPFALNNNNHILTMMYHVKFKHIESSIMSALGLEDLDGRIDKDKESIMSWISALINAHVDIAKDPYISRLNVNPFTYNLVNLLVRTGLGRKTFYFTSQPIMKHLANAYINAGATYMADPHKGKFKLQQEAVDEFAEKYFEELGDDAKRKIDLIKEGGPKTTKQRSEINKSIKELFDSDYLIAASKSESVDKEKQLLVYLAYLQFDKYANALSNLVKYSKIDTKKLGKSIVELMIYEKGYIKTFDTSREDSLFDPVGLSAMKNNSYISTKTDNAIGLTKDILKSQFIQSTPAFLGSIDKILKAVGREESLSTTLVSKAVNALSAAVKSKFFIDEYIPSITDNPTYTHDLVSESQEYLDFNIAKPGYEILLSGKTTYDLRSYCDGGYVWLLYKGADGNNYQYRFNIAQVDTKQNKIYVDKLINTQNLSGKILIKGGKNTIYDRFMRLLVAIGSNPKFAKLRSASGEISNRLLSMIVPGTVTEYKLTSVIAGEYPDTYETLKFIKLFNFVEDSGNTANYIIDGWEELLQYTDSENPEAQKIIRDFARDLIVYAFITSGDRSGFTKMFKYVPVSWREESGYGQFIHDKLAEYSIGFETDVDIEDVLLNNWYDNELVPTYYFDDRKTKTSNFMKYYTTKDNVRLGFPTILAALHTVNNKLEASIDPSTAPMFIKVPRRKDFGSENSQRRFTVYKMHRIAVSNQGVEYPVYIKVNPKGNQVTGNFTITEYGRSDNLNRPEYTIDEEVLRGIYQTVDVASHINQFKKTQPVYASIIEGLNRSWNEEQENVGITDELIRNKQFDDSQFSDEAMKHCKS